MENLNNKSALDIYQGGYYPKKQSVMKSPYDNKEFFIALRSAIMGELENLGFCTLLNWLIEQHKTVDGVFYAVLCDILCAYDGRGMVDIDNCGAYVPYIMKPTQGGFGESRIAWSDCTQLYQIYYYGVDKYIIDVREKGQEMHRRFLRNKGAVITRSKENSVISKAKGDDSKTKEEAKAEATQIRKAAKKDADRKAAEQTSQREADMLIKKYITADQLRFRQECEDEIAQIVLNDKTTLNKIDRMHEQMCDKTNSLQAAWSRALEEAAENLNGIKAEFYRHLHEWQVSLYPRELRPLCERYVELYRFINVDKLICEEILYQDSGSQEKPNANPDTVCALQKLNRTLTTFLRKFEISLNGMGLYVYYPKTGDTFDDMWHICEDEPDNCEGKKISQYIIPGIAKKANDDSEDDVIIRATVMVEK